MGVFLTQSPSTLSLAGWTLESEALMRGMGAWLLVCGWVSLGVLASGEGEGEGASGCVRWAGECCGDRAVLYQTPQGRIWPRLYWGLSLKDQPGLQSHPCTMSQSP